MSCPPKAATPYSATVRSTTSASDGPLHAHRRWVDGGAHFRKLVAKSNKDTSLLGSLSIISYNVLAQTFVHFSHYSGNLDFLKYEFRVQLLMDELASYKADVYFLQECDLSIYAADWGPWCKAHHYHFYLQHDGVKQDDRYINGLVILIHDRVFDVLSLFQEDVKTQQEEDAVTADGDEQIADGDQPASEPVVRIHRHEWDQKHSHSSCRKSFKECEKCRETCIYAIIRRSRTMAVGIRIPVNRHILDLVDVSLAGTERPVVVEDSIVVWLGAVHLEGHPDLWKIRRKQTTSMVHAIRTTSENRLDALARHHNVYAREQHVLICGGDCNDVYDSPTVKCFLEEDSMRPFPPLKSLYEHVTGIHPRATFFGGLPRCIDFIFQHHVAIEMSSKMPTKIHKKQFKFKKIKQKKNADEQEQEHRRLLQAENDRKVKHNREVAEVWDLEIREALDNLDKYEVTCTPLSVLSIPNIKGMLPNKFFASDHVAIGGRFDFGQRKILSSSDDVDDSGHDNTASQEVAAVAAEVSAID